jgi:acetyl-CoA/propionyl-CoA carboxylase biotin carboxyl carrier protein
MSGRPSPTKTPRFTSLLVANRGEIAVRILTAARAAGLRTVAVYSEADRNAPHVRLADTAALLGPGPATESYLSIPKVIAAALATGAQAIHPGYGFLSERAEFAQACADAGLIFVGPSAPVMELMGRKDQARKVAVAAGVPVVPAVEGADDDEVVARAADFGLPLLVKAAAGGGGKGMRIVRATEELAPALAAARREALASFGDDTMIVERFVETGRHIEVQVFGDEHGHVVHLGERDCSVQRRHQKVLEEAPAPTISPTLRAELTGAAVRLTAEVGYVNAGTVEFLVSGEEFFFLEMNTRLQVEHPVTEMVTGLDLVAMQFAVAQGESLPIGQDDVRDFGHAIEARIYAEDAYAGFLPQAGRVTVAQWPDGARVDAALESGQQIHTWYDPMLGKIITFGATREAARQGLVDALDSTAIIGVTTNTGFLRRLADSAPYRDAAIDTRWLDQHADDLQAPTPPEVVCIAGWVSAEALVAGTDSGPFGQADGWRLAGPSAPVSFALQHGGEHYDVQVDQAAGLVVADDREWHVGALAGTTAGGVRLELDGAVRQAVVEVTGTRVAVSYQGETHLFARRLAGDWEATSTRSDGSVVAPMPGVVTQVQAQVGDAVQAGDALGVLEAMKMELAVRSPVDGTVTDISVAAGAQVAMGDLLFTVTPAEVSSDAENDAGKKEN